MSNYTEGTLKQTKHRMNPWEALELLPLPIKAALWDAVTSYASYDVLLQFKKWEKEYGLNNAIAMTISWIKYGDKGCVADGKAWGMPISPTGAVKMKPLYSHEHLHRQYKLVA
jgi:hypothetical protein